MKLLLSAYACLPETGSEPGVGWRWAMHLVQFHEVVVLTHERFREGIESYISKRPEQKFPEFHYHDSLVLSAIPFNGATALPKYFFWQLTVMPLARRLMRRHRFDLVVHITMCTFRYPSWMGYLGAPFVIGPVGGGEDAPRALLAGLPLFEQAFEALRSLLIRSAKLDPLLWLAQRKARLVITRSAQTSRALPLGMESKAQVFLDIGSDAPSSPKPEMHSDSAAAPLRLIMVTRLLGWKGVHLAIKALATCRRRGVDARLELVGTGRLLAWLQALAAAEGVADVVTFSGHLRQSEVMARLSHSDVFLFPSLHDSGGMAVLEALSCALPVVCLDLGGPAITVTSECGYVISTAQATQEQVVRRLAEALETLALDQALRRRLAIGAVERAAQLSWQRSLEAGQAMIEAQLIEQR